jgi:NADH:ubiquinone oxidoreductase subunit H
LYFSTIFNFIDIVNAQKSIWFIFPLVRFSYCFLLPFLLTNRTPFDLPEAEAELVLDIA